MTLKTTVLIVDDDSNLRKLLRMSLENSHRVIHEAATAEEGLRLAIDLDAAHLRTLAHGVIGATEGVVRHLLDNNIAFNPEVIGKQVADLVWAGLRGVGRAASTAHGH